MHPAWHRGLRTCLQYVVYDRRDLEVQWGEVKVGELRPYAFPQLQETLSDEQILAMGWVALADVAVWPQLSHGDARTLADSIQAVAPRAPLHAATAASPRSAAYQATAVILRFILQAQARLTQPHAPRVDFEPLRLAINGLAHFRKDPVSYWQLWLRRVIETAAVTSPEEACLLAIAALRATLNVPDRFEYEAARTAASAKPNTNGPFELVVVKPRQGGSVIGRVGVFTELDPIKRKVSAQFAPGVPIDRYRMAYLLRSVCMAELLDDQKSGYFDTVTCTNASTGETWSYPRV